MRFGLVSVYFSTMRVVNIFFGEVFNLAIYKKKLEFDEPIPKHAGIHLLLGSYSCSVRKF